MVLVHVQLLPIGTTSTNRVRVKLNHEIKAQPMTLKKSVIRLNYNASGALTTSIVYAHLPFLSHYEVTSNSGEMLLPLSIDPTAARTSEDYHVKFRCEDVPREFDVSLFSDAQSTPLNLGTQSNEIQSVDLYFEVASLDNFV